MTQRREARELVNEFLDLREWFIPEFKRSTFMRGWDRRPIGEVGGGSMTQNDKLRH